MKAKALLYAAVAAMACLSCTREAEESGVLDTGIELAFTAEWVNENGTDSRTVLQDDGTNIWWMPGDEINLFFGDKASGRFMSDNSEPEAVVDFQGTLPVAIGSIETEMSDLAYWAVYPYNASNSCDGQSVTLSVSSSQIAEAGGFANKTFPAIAKSRSFGLAFYNVCGGVRFSLTQEGVKEVVFQGKNDEDIAGKVKVAFVDGVPAVQEITESEKTITLTAPGNGSFETGKWYYITIIPGPLSDGFKMTFNTDTQYATLKASYAKTIKRGIFGSLADADEDLIYKDKGDEPEPEPEAVDLGLPSGLKWASFNLGATKPEEYGDYFAWGEVEPKTDYSWSTYKWCKGGFGQLTKYCNSSSNGYNGFTDNKTILDPEDDAAAVNLGGGWRMPTNAEQDELRSQCTWTWTTQNGVNGRLVTGPNGNSIFLPAAGYMYLTNLSNVGSDGYDWSSSLSDGAHAAYDVGFNSSDVDWYNGFRYIGHSIRPVYRELVHVTGVELNESSLQLEKGATAQLIATITPEDASSKRVLWSSSDESIATVSEEGVVSGVGVGTAEITATTVDGGYTASCTISVICATPEAVDLGLPSGLKWASFNLGATKPEEYGDYFAWGEVEPKTDYSWSTYKWCKGGFGQLTKYCNSSSNGYNGFTDNKTILDPEDDAAAVNLGGGWRMPTNAEQDELRSQCTWTWTTQNGVNGRLVTGPNGNSIFLPAAGYRYDTSLGRVGSWGYYWSSSLSTDGPYSAYYVGFDSGDVDWYYDYRCGGLSIRPVTE